MKTLLLIGLLAVGCTGSAATPTVATEPPAATAAPTSWIPTGFRQAPNQPDVAVKFLDPSDFDCTYSEGRCWAMYAIARSGCPSSLYVELSIEDGSGNAIGYTNDTAGAIRPMQQAKLTFDTLEADAASARVTKVSCY